MSILLSPTCARFISSTRINRGWAFSLDRFDSAAVNAVEQEHLYDESAVLSTFCNTLLFASSRLQLSNCCILLPTAFIPREHRIVRWCVWTTVTVWLIHPMATHSRVAAMRRSKEQAKRNQNKNEVITSSSEMASPMTAMRPLT